MTAKTAFVKWALVSTLVSSILIVAQVAGVGGLVGLLHVDDASALRPVVERELGRVPLVAGGGHDSQIFYAIGLDLGGQEIPELLDHAGYRYRRILAPAIASLGGVLDGHALLLGMILLTVAASAVAAGAVAASARVLDLSDWLALAVVLNPGVWLSIRLLTSDVLALALMSLGLLAVLTGSRLTVFAFVLSGLSKDVYLTTPAGLAVGDPRRQWKTFVVPAVLLVVWMSWVTFAIGDGFTARGNLGLPGAGLIQASSNWPNMSVGDLFYLVFAIAAVTAAMVLGAARRSWLRWSLLGWGLLGLISSAWVWDFGNNAARAYAPIAVLVALSFGRPEERGMAAGSPTEQHLGESGLT